MDGRSRDGADESPAPGMGLVHQAAGGHRHHERCRDHRRAVQEDPGERGHPMAVRRGSPGNRGDRPHGTGTSGADPGPRLPPVRGCRRGRTATRRVLPRRRLRLRHPVNGRLDLRHGRRPGRGGRRVGGLPARAGSPVPRRGRGLLRRSRLGGRQPSRAGCRRARRRGGGERRRLPVRRDVPARTRARWPRDRPSGADLPGDRHDRRQDGRQAGLAVPFRRGDGRLQAALPRPRRRPGTPVGFAVARHRSRGPAGGPHPGCRARPAPFRRPALRRSTARGGRPGPVHRVRRRPARLRQLPRPVTRGSPGHERGRRRPARGPHPGNVSSARDADPGVIGTGNRR